MPLSDEAIWVSWVAFIFIGLSYLDPFLRAFRDAKANFHKVDGPVLKVFAPLMLVATLAGYQLYSSRYLPEDADGNVWTGGTLACVCRFVPCALAQAVGDGMRAA